jgi:hypothetical protein
MNRIILSLIIGVLMLWSFPSFADWQNNIGIQGLKWASITTAGTTVIKSGAAYLGTVMVTSGQASGVIIYNNTVSNASITTVSTLNATVPFVYPYSINLSSGITVSTQGNTNVLVSYL